MQAFIARWCARRIVLPFAIVVMAFVSAHADEPDAEIAAQEAVAAILQIDGDTAYGQFLAGECITCHQETGKADGIPAIVGIEQDYFVRSVVEYQKNIRDNEVMRLHVQNLGNEEVAALAAYFATLDPQ
ncbi:MAG: c-type cytochrome [Pseudomonadota bacterium]